MPETLAGILQSALQIRKRIPCLRELQKQKHGARPAQRVCREGEHSGSGREVNVA